MRVLSLGRTGLEVSRVGMGGIPIQRLSEVEAIRVVQRCLDLGITFIDTANSYTTSERRIGKAIAGRRDQVVIATKTGARDRATAWEHLLTSLKRLQVDSIDVWQLHNVHTFAGYEQVLAAGGAVEAAHEAMDAGLVKHLGITSHSMEVASEAVASCQFETVQFPLNFVADEAVEGLLPLAEQYDVGFIAMKPFGGGLIDDASIAVKYLLQFDSVLPDPGIERAEEIEEIVELVNGSWEMTEGERRKMARMRKDLGTRFCRRCEYCQPCPFGIRIPLIMHLESVWKRLPRERLLSGSIAQAVEEARQCTDCGECEEKCPYDLPIRQMIRRNLRFHDDMVGRLSEPDSVL